MNEGFLGRVARIYGNEVARVRAVPGRALETFIARRALDEHWLTFGEVKKPFENVNTTQGNPLRGLAGVAREGHLGEQPSQQLHPVSQAGWLGRRGLPAARNSSAIGS